MSCEKNYNYGSGVAIVLQRICQNSTPLFMRSSSSFVCNVTMKILASEFWFSTLPFWTFVACSRVTFTFTFYGEYLPGLLVKLLRRVLILWPQNWTRANAKV
jgi:hypothetical protein